MWLTTVKEYVIFDVKACSNARLSLSSTFGFKSSPIYDVHIGASLNSQTIIAIAGRPLATANTKDILACDRLDFSIYMSSFNE